MTQRQLLLIQKSVSKLQNAKGNHGAPEAERHDVRLCPQRVFMARFLDYLSSLPRMDKVLPDIERLGVVHARLDLDHDDYERMGAALLHSVRVAHGDDFTPELEEAWVQAYRLVSATMKAARGDGLTVGALEM